MTIYATPEIGSTFLTDVRPVDLRTTVRLLNFAADSDVNNEAGGDPTAYYTPDVPALQRLADKAAAQGNYIAWSAENGGAASPGVRYALAGDGVSNSGSWLFDQAGALTRIAFHASVLDVLRARQPALKIGLQFGVPANSTPAAAASNGSAYSDLLDAEAAAGLPSKVDYLIVTAFAGTADQAAWRAQVDFDAGTIADRYPGRQTMLMVNHSIGADNGSNYSGSFWRYQLDTASAKGWDVLLYNLGGPRAAEAWAVVAEYAEGFVPSTPVSTLYDAIWTLIENGAATPLLTKAGNRINRSVGTWRMRDASRKAPNDFPKIEMECGVSAGHSAWAYEETFATESTDFLNSDTPFDIERSEEVYIRITENKPTDESSSALREAVIDDIMRGGPRLGLDGFVWRIGRQGETRDIFRVRRRDTRDGETDPRGNKLPFPGTLTEIRFMVICQESGRAALIA